MSQAGTDAPAGPAQPRVGGRGKGRSFVGLGRSLLPLLILIILIAWLRQPGGRPVRPVDPGPDIRYARRVAEYHLLVPTGLPASWRPTSSRVDAPGGVRSTPVTLYLGYLTSAGRFVQLVETDRTPAVVLAAEIGGATSVGPVTAGGTTWQGYRTLRGEEALLRQPAPGVTVLLTGSAGIDELATLGAALR